MLYLAIVVSRCTRTCTGFDRSNTVCTYAINIYMLYSWMPLTLYIRTCMHTMYTQTRTHRHLHHTFIAQRVWASTKLCHVMRCDPLRHALWPLPLRWAARAPGLQPRIVLKFTVGPYQTCDMSVVCRTWRMLTQIIQQRVYRYVTRLRVIV